MAPTADSQVDSLWSWVILACSFTCLFCFSLLSTSVGMLQVEMIEDLGFGSGVISIMTSFAVGLSTLLGPLSGILASVLSMRFTIIIGTILMSLGMLFTAFSHSLPALLFFYGILTGLGHGIAYTPCIVIVHHYFEKKRILANGIMTSSSSFALLSLTYLHRYVIDEYGWRFCFAINAALLLHIIVFASFFKPTEIEKMSMISLSSCLSRKGDASKNGSECDDNDLNDDNNDEEKIETEKDGKCMKAQEEKLFLSKESFHSSVYLKKMDMIIKSTDNISLGSKTLSIARTSRPYIPIYINGTPKLRSPVNDLIAAESPSLRHSLHSEDGDIARSVPCRSISQVSSISTLSLDDHPATPTAITTLAPQSPTFLKPHKFGQLRKSSRSHLGSSLVFASCDLGSSIMLPVAIEEIKLADEELEEEETLKAKMNRIARCKPLWVLCINAMFFMFGCGTHAVHLPSFVESKGIGSHLMANIYTVLGVVIAIGRVAGGALYNRVKPPLLPLLFVLQFLNGLILISAPFFATEISTIFVMEAGIGLVYGQSYMIQAPVVTQIVGVEDLTIAFGFIQLFNGIGFICSPIISGFLYDFTGNFDIPFCFAGSVVLAGSFILLAMMISTRRDNKRRCKTGEAAEDETSKTTALIKLHENA